MSRLDRFLISPRFENKFPYLTQTAQPRPTSDHLPLLLDISDPSWGPSPFRFEAMWFQHKGSPSSILWQKLQALKDNIKKWNREELGNLNIKSQKLLQSIESLDRLEEIQQLDEAQLRQRLQDKVEYEKVNNMIESCTSTVNLFPTERSYNSILFSSMPPCSKKTHITGHL
ncbi:hypothetical protein BVC80_2757g1 [Macleaya cordata]|uniref:Endonuclease/exonuclease/phosphatase n=1 Tax=Macleaya cordata TaxID=56857 RepID=A0A200Q769_MACCD|nr:hypothetical protein BVC80_2757g1 [Macleaya cordata]